jgi:hypothetical protein
MRSHFSIVDTAMHKRSLFAISLRLLCALLACIALCAAATALTASSAAAADAPTGKLSVQVAGLPKGAPGSFVLDSLSSPAHDRYRVAGRRLLRRVPVGLYRINVLAVRIAHRRGAIARGARALPVNRRLKVRVRRGRMAKLELHYGSIINPGVRSVNGKVVAIGGDPINPSTVTLKRGTGVHAGSILSARPGTMLPHGLLAKVTALSRVDGSLVASLAPASIYDVAPNMSFDIPVESSPGAAAQALACSGVSGFSPYVHLSDIHLSGGWTTTKVLFARVTTGATVEVHFKVAPGVNVTAGAGLSCSLPLPGISIQGMAGPIPVYGALKPKASAQLAAGAKMHAEGSTEVTVGANFSAPGVVRPVLGFSSPRFSFGAELFASLTAGLGVGAEVGIGVAEIGNLHLALDNSLDFTASPGNCSWDLNLGTFSAGGKLGPFTISTPSTPPIYHRNLWHRNCGPGVAPEAPAATQPPPGPPPVALPQVRARMSWETESDVDLYAGDEYGNLAYFAEKDGIPDAELITDVIPQEGEYDHSSEFFQETANPNRHYTFGVCEYNGDGSEVTLQVTDPGGAVRTFDRTLYGNGDYELITTSPDGGGYDPGYGWCRYR